MKPNKCTEVLKNTNLLWNSLFRQSYCLCVFKLDIWKKICVGALWKEREEETKTTRKWDSLQISRNDGSNGRSGVRAGLCLLSRVRGPGRLNCSSKLAVKSDSYCHWTLFHFYKLLCVAVMDPNEAGYLHLIWFGKGHSWQDSLVGLDRQTHTFANILFPLSALSLSHCL